MPDISLADISTEIRLKPPKIVLYGVGGIGKTTWAASAPNPVFICTEEGLVKNRRLQNVAHFRPGGKPIVDSWQQVLDCVGALYTDDHEYRTVVLDTLDFAEPMLWEYTAKKHRQDDIEAFGYGRGYIYATDEARELTRGLDALRNDKGMAVIVLAHSGTKRYESPEHEAFDRYKLRVHDRLANLFRDWTDALLFANWRVHVVKDKKQFGGETARGVGTGERVVYTEERPAWWAKNRYGMPFEIELSWQATQEAIAQTDDKAINTKKKATRKKPIAEESTT